MKMFRLQYMEHCVCFDILYELTMSFPRFFNNQKYFLFLGSKTNGKSTSDVHHFRAEKVVNLSRQKKREKYKRQRCRYFSNCQ